MATVTPQKESEAASSSSKQTVANLQAIIRKAVQEADNGGQKPRKVKPSMPMGAQPTTWLFVNRDLSLVAPMNRYDEVYPGIYLGDEGFARDKDLLKKLGITHLLNAAQGQKFNQIDTTQAYYADLGLTFMGVKAQDIMTFKMTPHFQPAAKFIHEALQSGGKVAVHCHMGRSRSASLVLAYLMLHESLPLEEAIRCVCHKRPVFPNDGFLRQLIKLDEELRTENSTEKQDSSSVDEPQLLQHDKQDESQNG